MEKRWFDVTPEIRELGREICKAQKKEFNLHKSIASSFVWDWTPQGHKFWLDISNGSKKSIELNYEIY